MVGSRFARCTARREGMNMSGRFRRLLLLALAALVGLSLALGSAVRPAAASGAGTITIYPAMSGPWAMTVGPDGAFWFTDVGDNMIGRMSVGGKLTLFAGNGIDVPNSIVSGPDGALWFTNQGIGCCGSIGRITTAGKVSIFTASSVNSPAAITVVHQLLRWLNRSDNDVGNDHRFRESLHQQTQWDRGRAGWRPLVHQWRQSCNRANHDGRTGDHVRGREHPQPL